MEFSEPNIKYTKGGIISVVELRAFKNWFGKSKVVDSEGNPLIVYHGTVSDFDVFDINETNQENDWGRGFYFTNEIEDVNANYSHPNAPDITNKIERLAERIEQEEGIDYEKAKKKAKKKLLHTFGSIIPAYLSIKKPFEVGGGKRVYWESEYDENNDSATGKFIEFQQALKDVYNYGGYSVEGLDKSLDAAIGELQDNVGWEGGWVDNIIEEYKKINDFSIITDENGNLAGNDVLRQAIQKMGYDGIIDYTVDKKFGSQRRLGMSMEGMNPDTIHYIAFEPIQIKSAIGNRTFSKKNPSIVMAEGGNMEVLAPIVRANVSRIAKKHGVSKEYILERLKKGERIEAEHDKTIAYIKKHPSVSYKVARQMIALNHFDEAKEYYGEDFDIFEKTVEEKNKLAEGGNTEPVTFDNYFIDTYADFIKIKLKEIPNRQPDFASNSGSRYWHDGEYVIRQSNHWGRTIRSCNWLLNGCAFRGSSQGKCKLSNFEKQQFDLLKEGQRFKIKKTILIKNGGGCMDVEEKEGVFIKKTFDYYIFDTFRVGTLTLASVKSIAKNDLPLLAGGGNTESSIKSDYTTIEAQTDQGLFTKQVPGYLTTFDAYKIILQSEREVFNTDSIKLSYGQMADGGNLQTYNYIAVSNSKSQRFDEYSYVLEKNINGRVLKLKLLKYMYLTNSYKVGAPRGWIIVESGIAPEDFGKFYRDETGTKTLKAKL